MLGTMGSLNAIAWAVITDLIFGELPTPIHPTVYMGKYISRCKPRVRKSAKQLLVHGAAIVASGVTISAIAGHFLGSNSHRAPTQFRSLAAGFALKQTLSLRALLSAAKQIEAALANDDLDSARHLLSWHLVSRDTQALSASEVAGAAIESISENLSDSFIAPLLMYRAGGLSASFLYRFVNTADAMLGYRTPELEWLGKVPARTDDLLNIIPARVTSVLIAMAAPIAGGSVRNSLRVVRRDAHRTTSPNAGWPMAAIAGALNCNLTKRGVYRLNMSGVDPSVSTLRKARHVVATAAALGCCLLSLPTGIQQQGRWR